ncbi:MAG: glycosyltransferase family A protein [Acidovorax sp.]|uniref:glycosyltransferase family A protein n=1 Tax=Acidovorax sp. TaxID=1872122 RepID=UPI0039E6D606
MAKHAVSIVIPTTGKRQELLLRAIRSTCVDDDSLFINVIVVVNGPDSDKFILPDDICLLDNLTVEVIRTKRANVSHARNLGIANATGELLRFLDDDDFLIPNIAKKQYLEFIKYSADISTYAGDIQDETGETFQTIYPDGTSSYVCAVLGPNCPALTFASVYKTDLVRHLRWNEEWSTTEDEDWMRRISHMQNPRWIVSNDAVGVWYQHSRWRLSKPYPTNDYYINRALSIARTVATLKQDNRLERGGGVEARAAARGLWSAVHGGFYFSPFYWKGFAELALQLDGASRPPDKIFHSLPFIHPLIIEWIFYPKRIVNHLARLTRGWIAGFDSIRRIS